MRPTLALGSVLMTAALLATRSDAATLDRLNYWITHSTSWKVCPQSATKFNTSPQSTNPYFAFNGTFNDTQPGGHFSCFQSGPHKGVKHVWWVQVVNNLRPIATAEKPNPCVNGGINCTVDAIRVCSRSYVRAPDSDPLPNGPCLTDPATGGGIGGRGCESCVSTQEPG